MLPTRIPVTTLPACLLLNLLIPEAHDLNLHGRYLRTGIGFGSLFEYIYIYVREIGGYCANYSDPDTVNPKPLQSTFPVPFSQVVADADQHAEARNYCPGQKWDFQGIRESSIEPG